MESSPVSGERRCARHENALAPHVCDRCGDFICDACAVRADGSVHCAECRAKVPANVEGIPPGTECRADAIFARGLETAMKIALPAVLLGAVPNVLSQVWGERFQAEAARIGMRQEPSDLAPLIAIGGLVITWLMLRVQAATQLLARASLHGRPIGIAEAWRGARGRPLPLFVAQLLIAARILVLAVAVFLVGGLVGSTGNQLAALLVFTGGGFVALVLLLIGYSRWAIFGATVVFEKASGRRSIPRSVELTRGHRALSFITGVLPAVGLAILVVFLTLGLPLIGLPPLVSAAIEGLASLVSSVITSSLDTSLYFGLRRAEADASAI